MANALIRVRNVCPKCGASRYWVHKSYGDTAEEWQEYVRKVREKEPTHYLCNRCGVVPRPPEE